ncbi:MAG: hypothetical protein AB1749_16865 [Pseudomonadota bacterium]
MQHLFNLTAQAAKVAAFWLLTATPVVVSLEPAVSAPAPTIVLAEIRLPPSNPRRR